MPYYCTVPRCTSMAGKAKNVSFHQFPRDEELARLWNKILKRGKPYTKYSKVCSLHFRPEDYTITSVGKNKGQWRTLRKDAIPSQNLPSESPGPTTPRHRNTGSWVQSLPPNVIDSRVQQQVAQAIYMQTMLAMQAATNGTAPIPPQISEMPNDPITPNTSKPLISEIEQLLQRHTSNGIERLQENQEEQIIKQEHKNITSYKCEECSKCFKDPDVFILHRRTHTKRSPESPHGISVLEKENLNSNRGISRQETLKANPILANLLKSGMSSEIQELPNGFNNIFDVNNILSIENQIMTALAANMESYIRNLSSMLAQAPSNTDFSEESSPSNGFDHNSDVNNDSNENSNSKDDNFEQKHDQSENVQHENFVQENGILKEENSIKQEDSNFEEEKSLHESNLKEEDMDEGSPEEYEPNCDIEDLNESKDSNNLVIDESM